MILKACAVFNATGESGHECESGRENESGHECGCESENENGR